MKELFTFKRIKQILSGQTVFRVMCSVELKDDADTLQRAMTTSVMSMDARGAFELAVMQLEAWVDENRQDFIAADNQYRCAVGIHGVAVGRINTALNASSIEQKGGACTCDGGNAVVSTRQGKATLSVPLAHASWCKAKES